MSAQAAIPSTVTTPTPTFTERLAVKCLAKIADNKMSEMTDEAVTFIGCIGGAPKSDSVRDVMTNLGAAFGNYEQNGTSIIKSLISTRCVHACCNIPSISRAGCDHGDEKHIEKPIRSM